MLVLYKWRFLALTGIVRRHEVNGVGIVNGLCCNTVFFIKSSEFRAFIGCHHVPAVALFRPEAQFLTVPGSRSNAEAGA